LEVFFINFGLIEFESYLWAYWLGGKSHKAKDKAIGLMLSPRITFIKTLVSESSLTEEDMKKADSLWTKVSNDSLLRNRIAHNPFIRKSKNELSKCGIADAKTMIGPGPYKYNLLEVGAIADAALDAARLAESLQDFRTKANNRQ
jgi:hypothetical protein